MFTEIVQHLLYSVDQIRERKSSGAYKGECITVEADLFPEISWDILSVQIIGKWSLL